MRARAATTAQAASIRITNDRLAIPIDWRAMWRELRSPGGLARFSCRVGRARDRRRGELLIAEMPGSVAAGTGAATASASGRTAIASSHPAAARGRALAVIPLAPRLGRRAFPGALLRMPLATRLEYSGEDQFFAIGGYVIGQSARRAPSRGELAARRSLRFAPLYAMFSGSPRVAAWIAPAWAAAQLSAPYLLHSISLLPMRVLPFLDVGWSLSSTSRCSRRGPTPPRRAARSGRLACSEMTPRRCCSRPRWSGSWRCVSSVRSARPTAPCESSRCFSPLVRTQPRAARSSVRRNVAPRRRGAVVAGARLSQRHAVPALRRGARVSAVRGHRRTLGWPLLDVLARRLWLRAAGARRALEAALEPHAVPREPVALARAEPRTRARSAARAAPRGGARGAAGRARGRGHGRALDLAAILYFHLTVPFYCVTKASYLAATTPLLAVLAASGYEAVSRARWARGLAVSALVCWAANVVATYWVYELGHSAGKSAPSVTSSQASSETFTSASFAR